jgi:transcriptional repressor NrdR
MVAPIEDLTPADDVGIRCPHCGRAEHGVKDKRSTRPNAERRRRQCDHCGQRFTTFELNAETVAELRAAGQQLAELRQILGQSAD